MLSAKFGRRAFLGTAALAAVQHYAQAKDPLGLGLDEVLKPPPPLKKVPSQAEIVAAVLADLTAADEVSRLSYRYLWFPNPRESTLGAALFVLNSVVSRSHKMQRFVTVGGPHLVRIDLRPLCPKAQDFVDLTHIWDRLAGLDPYFHIGKDAIVQVDEFVHANGNKYSSVQERRGLMSPHLGEAGPALLALTQRAEIGLSAGTILRGDWFISKAVSTLQGGQYYSFIGAINRVGQKLSQTEYLLSRGASEEQVEKLNSDQRAALVESKVTGKPRRIDMFRGVGARLTDGLGLVSVTRDGDDEDTGPDTDPIRNLLKVKDKAREVILERANGLLEYTLFDGEGKLQLSAPSNVVSDRTVPAPHTTSLQPMISCIRCHGPDEGWKPANNDILTLRRNGFLALYDLQSKTTLSEAVERLESLYQAEPEPIFIRARTFYDTAAKAASGLGVTDVCRAVSDIYLDYWYTKVGSQVALAELGFLADDAKQATEVLKLLVPPLPPQEPDGVAPEDPWIGFLASGVPIPRNKWEEIFVDVSIRAAQRLQSLRQSLKEEVKQ